MPSIESPVEAQVPRVVSFLSSLSGPLSSAYRSPSDIGSDNKESVVLQKPPPCQARCIRDQRTWSRSELVCSIDASSLPSIRHNGSPEIPATGSGEAGRLLRSVQWFKYRAYHMVTIHNVSLSFHSHFVRFHQLTNEPNETTHCAPRSYYPKEPPRLLFLKDLLRPFIPPSILLNMGNQIGISNTDVQSNSGSTTSSKSSKASLPGRLPPFSRFSALSSASL